MASPADHAADTLDTVADGRISRRQARQWTVAVFVIFFVCGLAMASWLARIPAIRDGLQASTFQMGLLIVGLSGGSIVGLTLSSHVIARIGATRTMLWTVVDLLAGLIVVGLGAIVPSYWVILLGLIIYGLGTSACDVAMNLSGAANERVMGRTLMPLFHAMFSLGTMAGAGLGALAEHAHVKVLWHVTSIAVVGLLAALWAIPRIQPESLGVSTGNPATTDSDSGSADGWKQRLAVWKQPATLLIGVIVLGMAFAEGSAGDWLALGMVDDRGTSKAGGALIYAVFVTAMTVGRVGGVFVLDRFGRVPVLRATAATALAGLALVIFVPSVTAAVIGTVLWGLGASLGFPVGMSAAADDPHNAAARVSAVATIGYLAFLVGPPVLGLLGEHFGLLNALILVMALIAAAVFAAPAAREAPLVTRRAGAGRRR